MLDPDSVLEFWFADANESPAKCEQRGAFWFTPDTEVDRLIWEVYADAVTDTGAGYFDDWLDTSTGHLALILLLDQFPRNIFRGTSEVYRYDARALEIAGQGITLGHMAGRSIPEQAFFLMPYQHSEDLAVQRAGVDLTRAMADGAPLEWQAVAQNFLAFAIRHHDIVAEYGRFPHRNGLLGRHTTEAEARFLSEGGETFGQAG